MKKQVIVKRKDQVLYIGNILDLPVKQEYIIKRSIELFDDDDPCIIHTSFVIKERCDQLLDVFKHSDTNKLDGTTNKSDLDFIDFTDIESITIELS